MPWLDIHCHLLPGLDDGSENEQTSLQLVKRAIENGITHCIFTPHIHIGRYDNDLARIKACYLDFVKQLKAHKLELQTGFAAEVRIGIEIVPMIEQGQIPFLGDDGQFQYLLLEMPHSHILAGSGQFIQWLRQRQIKAIIAHPERNKELQRNPQKAAELKQWGCLFQLTAASISGRFGSSCQQTADYFLRKNWVDFVATDAHNLQHRPPDLLQSHSRLIQIKGEQETENLLFHNAWEICQNQFISAAC